MLRRRLTPPVIALAAATALLTACGSGEDSESPEDARRNARTAVESYVKALNARDEDRLIEVGGVPDDPRARREARRILADKGGRGLSVTEIRISLDMGPDVASAQLTTEERSDKKARDSFSVVRENGTWHLTVFTDRPPPPGKPTSSAEQGGASPRGDVRETSA